MEASGHGWMVYERRGAKRRTWSTRLSRGLLFWTLLLVGMVRETDGAGSAETGWDSVRGGLTDAVGRAVCGVWTARATVAATRIQRMVREQWAGGWLGDSMVEKKPLSLTVATWNTRKLKMSLRLSLASWENSSG